VLPLQDPFEPAGELGLGHLAELVALEMMLQGTGEARKDDIHELSRHDALPR
jgi:hypothetical protein